ncbi:Phosphate metabolism transcription protein [Cymbomonas tetramitiformis]|uniref:GDP-D-glucose phosphorylase 1 n=1 Tax=Cymbomonas tetramitiformis TaxID=36881 RepID=A0AAE0BLW4_9CHLO|nr:Phosphate metabolism transcription protein [Cymbomonas tetramitiformis]|eukprot:gene11774-13898_t
MLTITRVPTVLSLNQLDSPEKDAKKADKGNFGLKDIVLNEEGLADARLPLYYFLCRKTSFLSKKVRSFGDLQTVPDIDQDSSSGDESDQPRSLFDHTLLAEWENKFEEGLFRYDVTACQTKVIPGDYGFVAQLNEGRATKKRATEFRVDKVLQDFDDSKFNFTKAGANEVLFQFAPNPNEESGFEEAAPVRGAASMVLINVSPIEYGHCLLVPRITDRLPQRVDHSTALLALQMAAESNNPYFRIGYNSLGAYATINHLHFQGYYLMAPFPVERAPTAPLTKLMKRRRADCIISRLQQYPVRGLVFEIGKNLDAMAGQIGMACEVLQTNNIPFNLFIVDCGKRVFLFPQCYAEKQAQGLVPEELLDTGVNPAAFEICGHMVLKRSDDYVNLTEEFTWRLLAEVSLTEERFQEVVKLCFP